MTKASVLVMIVTEAHEHCPAPGAIRVHGQFLYIRAADYEKLRTQLPQGHVVRTPHDKPEDARQSTRTF